jgi:hypothetical protein
VGDWCCEPGWENQDLLLIGFKAHNRGLFQRKRRKYEYPNLSNLYYEE